MLISYPIFQTGIFQGMNYPPGGDNKLYSKGLTIALDSFAEIDYKDLTLVKDYHKLKMFQSGKLEDEDTPMDSLNQPRILLHDINEIPSFLSTKRTPLTLSSMSNYIYSVAEVKIPLKVNRLPHCDITI